MTVSRPGVVHALMGENGSGKSTLLGVLSGQLRPDRGAVALEGRPADCRGPADALSLGIAMVSQETAVAPDLTVAENILLGQLPRGRLGVSWAKTRTRAHEALGLVGADLDPGALVRSLRPDQKQMVEIARAMSWDAKLIILDEPTSSLSDDEVEGLFAAIARLKREGVAILFVSHRLGEVFEIADEMTVLRDGITVATGSCAGFTPRSLVAAMVGTADLDVSGEAGACDPQTPARLSVRDLSVPGILHGVSLDVCEGEIVGLAGLVGSGRSELLEAIFGTRTSSSDLIAVGGEQLTQRSPQASIARGVGFVPPDRKTQGLVLSMTVRENLAMVATCSKRRLSVPNGRDELPGVRGAAEAVKIAASLDAVTGTLSGGNQQKVALGKWLVRPPQVLLLDEPTRGVDVGAKAEIHHHLRETASKGAAILVSSSEYDELLDLCNRIVVLFRGRVMATLARSEATEAGLAMLSGGHS
jgi:ABC-type sugar transport system ATPase subunit